MLSNLRPLPVLLSSLLLVACVSPSAGGPTSETAQSSPPAAGASEPAANESVMPSMAALTDDQAWLSLIPGEPESISYRSMAELARDADAVVIASPGSLTDGPDFNDEYGNVIHMATLTLNVERVIRGRVNEISPGTIALWIHLGEGDPGGYDYADQYARLSAAKPAGRAVFYLKNMAAWIQRMGGPSDHPQADPNAYQILGGQGFQRDVQGRVRPPALSPDSLNEMAGRWHADLKGRSFAELVRSLDDIAKTNP